MQLEISKETDHGHNKALTLTHNKAFKLFSRASARVTEIERSMGAV